MAKLGTIDDRQEQAKQAHALADALEAAAAEARRVRADAMHALVADGMSQGAIGRFLGLTRARVGKILESGPQPERVLLGTGSLTVAIGGKTEGPKTGGVISTVTSEESERAYELIRDAADAYGLQTSREVVRPPGHSLELDRPNLIVIGSPRLLPLMNQVLAADRNLGFEASARGWRLTEGDNVHRSPSDNGEHADLAYIGRLPRTDSKGTFLYLAGIHAPGTVGAATYLVNHVKELYDEVKRGRWSVLVRCEYDPDTREIEAVEPITPIYKS